MEVIELSADELSSLAATGESAPAAEPQPPESKPTTEEKPKESSAPPEPKAGQVETESDSETDDDHGEDTDQEPARQISNRDRKIGRLTSQREYQRARADQLQRELEQLRQQAASAAPQATPRDADGAPVPPDETKFDTYAEFQAAQRKYEEERIDYLLEKREREREAQRAEATARERIQKFKQATPDFDEVADSVDLSLSPALNKLIYEHDDAPRLVYYLGKNPQEFERIASFQTPARQMFELGRVMERMEAPKATPAPAKKAKPLTAAPDPLEPVGTSTAPTAPSEITQDGYLNPEWEKEHLAKLAKRR